MSEFPESLLRRWPGRFRITGLNEYLAGRGPTPGGHDEVVEAVLSGMIDGYDEGQAVDQLVAEGRFREARRLLDAYPLWDGDFVVDATRRIEVEVARRQRAVAASHQTAQRRAQIAGVAWPPVLGDLLERCVEDALAVGCELEEATKELDHDIANRRQELSARIDDQAAHAATASVCQALFNLEQLEAVVHLLDHGSLDFLPPEAVDRLPALPQSDTPAKLLSWHLDPSLPRSRDFDRRWSPSNELAAELLVKFSALESGGAEAAAGFATALSAFLIGPGGRVAVDPVAHGHLAELPQVFDVPQIRRLLLSTTMQLYVCEPDVRSPPSVSGLGPHVLVGWGLSAAARAGRADGAVLALEDLLRLVTVRTDRAVAVLRIVGPQWSPGSLGAGSPMQLDRLLRSGNPWELLSWLTDVAGLGGSVTAARLAYLSGEYDARILFTVIEYLMQPGPHPHVRTSIERLTHWWDNIELDRRIEEAVLAPIRGSSSALTAFWAALASSIPGNRVTIDDLVVTCSFKDGNEHVEPILRDGTAKLGRHPSLTIEVDDGGLRLRPSGAVLGLRERADARLLGRLSRSGGIDALVESAGEAPLTAWSAHRFAMLPEGAHLTDALANPPVDRTLVERVGGMSVTDLLALEPDEPAHADLSDVLETLLAALGRHRPNIDLGVEGSAVPSVATRRSELLVVLFELLNNAAEAIVVDPARIRVRVRDFDPVVVIEVRDSGSGISDDIEDFQVFQRNVTTKGEGRGDGLYLARQLVGRVDGQLTVTARRSTHPVLKGAIFRLVLPRSRPSI